MWCVCHTGYNVTEVKSYDLPHEYFMGHTLISQPNQLTMLELVYSSGYLANSILTAKKIVLLQLNVYYMMTICVWLIYVWYSFVSWTFHFLFDECISSIYELDWMNLILVRACGVPAVIVRAVDCWQWRSGHYSHQSFLLRSLFFSPLLPFLIEGVLGSKNLFSKSCLERPKT